MNSAKLTSEPLESKILNVLKQEQFKEIYDEFKKLESQYGDIEIDLKNHAKIEHIIYYLPNKLRFQALCNIINVEQDHFNILIITQKDTDYQLIKKSQKFECKKFKNYKNGSEGNLILIRQKDLISQSKLQKYKDFIKDIDIVINYQVPDSLSQYKDNFEMIDSKFDVKYISLVCSGTAKKDIEVLNEFHKQTPVLESPYNIYQKVKSMVQDDLDRLFQEYNQCSQILNINKLN